MKKLFFLFVCAAIAAACSSEMEVPSPINPDDEMVEVSFNLGGDYVSVEETPMTRADEGKTYYKLYVYTTYPEFLTGHVFYRHIVYAYGLFTSLEKARIMVPKGTHLVYEALVIKELNDKLYCAENVCKLPFDMNITNSFIYNENFKNGYSNMKILSLDQTNITNEDGADVEMAEVDRYYGKLEKTITGSEDITIPMSRYSFAFTFNVVPPIDGKVIVECNNRILYEKDCKEEAGADTYIYNSPHLEDTKDKGIPVTLAVKWVRGSQSAKEHIVTETINIERKKEYKINVNLNDREGENGFGFDFDDEEFAEEVYDIK